MRRLLHYFDKIVLVGCVLLFLGAAFWATMRFQRLEEVAALNPSDGNAPATYEPQLVQMPKITLVSWPEPPAQSPPRRWVYDAFTPPVIYVNPETRELTHTPPEMKVQVAATEAPFEVELVSVSREEYRIQLKGYTGATAILIVTENGESRSVLARAGRDFSEREGNFSLRSFEVKREEFRTEGSMPVVENVGTAVILDGRTGREVTLTTREKLMLPRLQCVLRARAFPGEMFTLREGMKVTVNGYDYHILSLALDPAQAVVSRRPPNSIGGTETRTLFPVPNTGGPSGLSAGAPGYALGQFHRLPTGLRISE